jgi:hypothetical protein
LCRLYKMNFTESKDVDAKKLVKEFNTGLEMLKVPTEQPRRTRAVDAGSYKMSEWGLLALFANIHMFQEESEVARGLET